MCLHSFTLGVWAARTCSGGFRGAGSRRIWPGEVYPPSPRPVVRLPLGNLPALARTRSSAFSRGEGSVGPTGGGMSPGTFLLFPAWHRYRPLAEVGWDEWWVSFNGEMIDGWSASSSPRRAGGAANRATSRDSRPLQPLLERLRGELDQLPHPDCRRHAGNSLAPRPVSAAAEIGMRPADRPRPSRSLR